MVGARGAVVLVLFAVAAVALSGRALGGSGSGPSNHVYVPPIDAASTTEVPVLRSETVPPTTTTAAGCLAGVTTRAATPLPGLELPAGTPVVVAGHDRERGWMILGVGGEPGWILADGVDVDFATLTPCT